MPGIPDSLLKNSDAVARLMSVDFVYNTPTSASAKFVEETTILNNTATDKGSFTCYVSPTSSLKNFSGTLCDAQGRTLRKFKRSDLKYTEFSGGSLASDIATYYLEVYAPSYPYTVRYEYEMAYKNGLFNFPTFIPVGSKGHGPRKGSLHGLRPRRDASSATKASTSAPPRRSLPTAATSIAGC